jgi:predicted nucleic acid-binding protein
MRFVDSCVWIAALFEKDGRGEVARSLLDRQSILHTSTFVLDEVVSFHLGNREMARYRHSERKRLAAEFLSSVQKSSEIKVLEVLSDQFVESKTRFEQNQFPLSLTDWSNLIVMRDNGLTELFTFDNWFRDAVKLQEFSKIHIIPAERTV